MKQDHNRRATVLCIIGAAAGALACGSDHESQKAPDDPVEESCTGGSSGASGSGTGGSSDTGGSSTSGSTGTGGTWAGASSGGSSGAAACNTLPNFGTVLHYVDDPSPIPEMTGGPITDGTYVLTSMVTYAGISADPMSTVRQTIDITGNGTIVEQVALFDGEEELRRTISQAPAGNELNAAEVCPMQAPPDRLPYTATPTSLTVLFEPANANLVLTYTRPDCVGPAEGHFCAPDGFPFVQRAFAISETCPGEECHPPNPTLTQPEPGTLCMSGTATQQGQALHFLLFVDNQGGSEILDVFDADALGITAMSFTLDSPPASGITVDATNIAPRDCRGPLFNCLAFGFTGPRITEPGTTTLPLVDFLQTDPGSPYQVFDTSAIGGIGFLFDEGPFDFCLRDFKFLDAFGDEVNP